MVDPEGLSLHDAGAGDQHARSFVPASTAAATPLKVWKLTKGPSLSPRVFFQHVAVFCGVLLLGAMLLLLADKPAAAFACLVHAMLSFGIAAWMAVHMADGDQVLLYADELVVLTYSGLQCSSHVFPLTGLVIEAGLGGLDGGAYWFCHGQRRVAVGDKLDVITRCLAISEIAQTVAAYRNAG
jgi:hypothetical protein